MLRDGGPPSPEMANLDFWSAPFHQAPPRASRLDSGSMGQLTASRPVTCDLQICGLFRVNPGPRSSVSDYPNTGHPEIADGRRSGPFFRGLADAFPQPGP